MFDKAAPHLRHQLEYGIVGRQNGVIKMMIQKLRTTTSTTAKRLADFDEDGEEVYDVNDGSHEDDMHGGVSENLKDVEGESDTEEVPETNFEEVPDKSIFEGNSVRQSDVHSEDPFGIYEVLNKNRVGKNIDDKHEDSLKYPPGFTPNEEGDVPVEKVDNWSDENRVNDGQEDGVCVGQHVHERVEVSNDTHESTCSGHFKKSEVPRKGGSILELIDDLVNVGQTMGYDMTGCLAQKAKKDWVKELCVSYKKINDTVSDYFIMVRGVWVSSGKRLLIISKYAPQEDPRSGLHLTVDKTEVFLPKEDPRSRFLGVFQHNIARPLHGAKLLGGPASVDYNFSTIFLLLTGIGDEIYSTVDACKIANEMWIAIERLQQGESLNIQDVKTNLFWEFRKFTSHEWSLITPEWSRFVTIVKQAEDIDTVSYHKLFDILKQYQKEVNEIHKERIAKTPKHSYSTSSSASTRHKGKEIAKPVTPPSESDSDEDSDPEQAQKDKEMQKNLTLIAKYFKKLYKPTNNNLRTSSNSRNKTKDTTPRYKNDNQSGQFENQRTTTVAGARETVGIQVVQKNGIQCFNCKEYGHFARECRKPKRVKDYSYHKEKMLLCKQAEKGVPLQAEQVRYDDEYNVFANERQHSEQPKSINDTYVLEKDDSNVTPDSSNIYTKENKKVLKQLKKANASLTQELKDCNSKLDESNRALRESNSLLKEKSKVISDLKVKERKDIDTMIDMDKQIKFVNEILYKRNQSIQTIHILAPKCSTYNGRSIFANPKYLKKAQSEKPCLYKIPYDTSDLANRFAPNGEETVTLANESRSKLNKNNMKPYDYTLENSLYEIFKPLSQTYLDQMEQAKEVRKTMWRKMFVRTKPNIAKNVAFLLVSKSISKSRQVYNEMTNNMNHFRTICEQAWTNHTSTSFRNPTAYDMEVLIKLLLMPLAHKSINDSYCFVHEFKTEMHEDLEYVKSIKKELDELESEKDDFQTFMIYFSKSVCLKIECECLTEKLSKQTKNVDEEVHNNMLKSFSKLEQHSISLELSLQQCQEQMKNDTFCKENRSNVFLKEQEQYHEIQDLKAQMQDKNTAINELKKLIEKCKEKSVETQFDKPSVVRQPNAQRIPKPSVLGKPTPFSNSPEMRNLQTKQSVTKTNVSDGINHSTSVSRPQLKSNQVKDKVMPNNSQVKFKGIEVEDHHRISSNSKKTNSVTACNNSLNSRTTNYIVVCADCGQCLFDSNYAACVSRYLNDVNARTKKPKVVPISDSKPKRKANKSVATPHKKTVASDTTIQKYKSYYKELYKNTTQAWKWWIAKKCPSGYKWTQKPPKTKKI
ncbi:retrovirus-related pol polyprotein from transposon TNT 1-94 [Tanacetum coccineum]|uniref:Retrovirus-related pol polyprotein from transposon TNT 1-94 n=1 Tax=Tanacetum coccineum TaxID=301880 RepID=A0ABQ5AF11_9ASTR